ncbi:chemotaxis response regulator protein-glutamate methylesterase [Pleomorphomonas diazotrophica]|uniref:Protein-glutamate methylesterase/protein-glutamine glutaminase n=1 Tax=Pleomorphomonas diazotrophica TaxID=1166257 RepID=A0A1I4T6G1_9HYPH|nr:chemotaxis response regulator protein-glutamate methylesterase [Pleomorphomonas diazotrophica]PKR89533.1 chemotaxis response regulator protein-glutamate methylesterase [Pleomorphomonas diazotrophica]SFM72235.1 two-component system, chemotaxis family, response regulator CheB [Pleomorphomonas diazotrophica]
MSGTPIRVLIVDDSALMRDMLASVLAHDPEIQVVGTASDPFAAREAIKRLNPDVLTLDVEMPGMNGISFLEKLMALRPMPVVMVSTLTQAGALSTLRALEIGAVDVVAKPGKASDLDRIAAELIDKIKIAAAANVGARRATPEKPPARFSAPPPPIGCSRTGMVIGIGASTGGVEAIRAVLTGLPSEMPPILIVQHMPGQFTGSFASRLDGLCALHVKEAEDGELLRPGTAYVGPGGRQFELGHAGPNLTCRLGSEDRVSGHAPSVDVLFRSMARVCPINSLGVILTGMGRDGASGLLDIRLGGGRTIGQNEATSVVYGMPRAAFEIGAVERQLPLHGIAPYLAAAFSPEAAEKAHA